jgi:SAM-dependent methyltransferase
MLEVGCGTGNVSSYLSKKGYSVTGCDLYSQAFDLSWEGFKKVRGDLGFLPFREESFDIAGLFDVIEHFDNDISPLKEASRVVRGGGIISLTVPAGKHLWGYADETALHKRRYSKERCRNILLEAGLEPLLIEYMFMLLYIPIKFLIRKDEPRRAHFQINRYLNTFLKAAFHLERQISQMVPLPVGTSIIAVARKRPYP